MQSRSYNQLIDRLREVDVPSFEATSERFAASAAVGPATGLGASMIQVASAVWVAVIAGAWLWFDSAVEPTIAIPHHNAARQEATNFATADGVESPTPPAKGASVEVQALTSVKGKVPGPLLVTKGMPASATQTNVDPANAKQFDIAESHSAASELSVAEEQAANIATVEPHHLVRSLNSQPVAGYAISLPIDQGINTSDWHLTVSTAFGTHVARTSARAAITRDLGYGFAIGLAGGVGNRVTTETRFAGFRDTVIESNNGSMTSRIGQFEQQDVSKQVYHGAAVVSYEPSILQVGMFKPGLQVLTGFVASDFLVETSVSLRVALSGTWMIFGSTGASVLALATSTPKLTASLGLSMGL